MALADPTQIVEAIARLEAKSEGHPGIEHRLFTRFDVRTEAWLEPIEDLVERKRPIEVMVRNISRGGVGFVASRPLNVGSVWRIVFMRRGRQIASHTIALRFSQPIEDHIHLAGAQFVVDPALLLTLGVDEAQLSRDIRYDPRRAGAADADFAPPDEAEGEGGGAPDAGACGD